jgi:hypothetical protein
MSSVYGTRDGANSNQLCSRNKAPLSSEFSSFSIRQKTDVTSDVAVQVRSTPLAESSNAIRSELTSFRVGRERRSDIQSQFEALCAGFERTLADLSVMNLIASRDSKELRNQIQDLLTMTQEQRAKLLDITDFLKKQKDDSAFLLSRKTDLSRHIDNSQKLVEIICSADPEFSMVDTQSLDMESEMKRRKFAAVIWKVSQKLQLAHRQLTTLEAVGNNRSNGHLYLLGQIADLYKCAQAFEPNRVLPISSRVSLASKNFPQLQERLSGRSTYCLENPPFQQNNKTRDSLVNSDKTVGHQNNESPKTKILRWRATERSIQASDYRTNKFNRIFDCFQHAVDNGVESSSSHRKNAPSVLLSPTPSRAPQRSSAVSECLFSPVPVVKARGGWDRPSTIERERVQQSLGEYAPTELQQTTLSEASRQMLSSIGSTPEKLKSALAMKRKDSGLATTSPKSSNPKDNDPAIAFTKGTSEVPLRAHGTLPPSKSPAPLLPAAPHKFVSQPFGTNSDSSMRSDLPRTSASLVENSLGFDDMKGLGESLLDAENGLTKEKDQINERAISGTSSAALFAPPQTQTRDYKAILKTMLQQGYPAKLGEVDAILRKYEVSGSQAVSFPCVFHPLNLFFCALSILG